MTSTSASIAPLLVAMGLLTTLSGLSGCKQCEKGYELQEDGTCYAQVTVGSETWDTGSEDRSDQLTEPSSAEVQGEIRPGDFDLTTATDLSVELWLDQEMDIYGPDRATGSPNQLFTADLAALQGGSTAEFSGEHPGIPLRGRDIFLFVRLDWSDRAEPTFFEADGNPYLLRQDAESERVVIQLDSSAIED